MPRFLVLWLIGCGQYLIPTSPSAVDDRTPPTDAIAEYITVEEPQSPEVILRIVPDAEDCEQLEIVDINQAASGLVDPNCLKGQTLAQINPEASQTAGGKRYCDALMSAATFESKVVLPVGGLLAPKRAVESLVHTSATAGTIHVQLAPMPGQHPSAALTQTQWLDAKLDAVQDTVEASLLTLGEESTDVRREQ